MSIEAPKRVFTQQPNHNYFTEVQPLIADHKIISTFDSEADESGIVNKAWQIHAQCYVDFNYFNDRAIQEDGTLLDELYSTGEQAESHLNYEYLLALPAKNPVIQQASGTLRLIGAAPEYINELPTVKYLNGLDSAPAKAKMRKFVTDKKGDIREIAALSLATGADHAASYELMRALIQDAMIIQERENGRQIGYIASLTDFSLKAVMLFGGPGTVQDLDERIKLFAKNDYAEKDIFVTPVIIEPCRALSSIANEIRLCSNPSTQKVLLRRLEFLADGLTDSQLGDEVASLLKSADF